jgi:hypothetical protein
MSPNQIFIRCYDGDEIPIIDDNDDRMASIGDAEQPSDAVARGGAAIDGVVSHGHTMVVNAGIAELQFASKRASSRLMEMTSDRWWRCKRIAKKEESSLPSSKAQTPK